VVAGIGTTADNHESMSPDNQSHGPVPGVVFATTRWSVVLAAGGKGGLDSLAALEALCRAYWRPIFSHIRRAGRTPQDAEDLTQEFFSRLLTRDDLARLERGRGRFRNFLLVSVRHFLADESDKSRAQKRGGGVRPLSIDAMAEGDDAVDEPIAGETAEQLFDRRWAETLLGRARQRLREECDKAGRLPVYEALGPEGNGDVEEDYATVGARIGLSVAGVKSAAFRLRARYRELIRAEVAETVSSPEELDEELRHLLRVVSQR
jgi:DNA-directed RNA polymerase specialized sigma24 family protein